MSYIINSICASFGTCRVDGEMVLNKLFQLLLIAVGWNFVGFYLMDDVHEVFGLQWSIVNVLLVGLAYACLFACAILTIVISYAVIITVYEDSIIDKWWTNLKVKLDDITLLECRRK